MSSSRMKNPSTTMNAPNVNAQYGLSEKIPQDCRPVIFVGPTEHHSNEVMWRETYADVVAIDEDEFGYPCVKMLKEQLNTFCKRPLIIGAVLGRWIATAMHLCRCCCAPSRARFCLV